MTSKIGNPDKLKNFETRLITTFLSLIDGGFSDGRIALAETAAADCGVSRSAALGVLRRYTGPASDGCFWCYRRGSRGQRIYQLQTPDTRPASQPATH